MICFAFKEYQEIAKELIKENGYVKGRFRIERFPNQELYVLVEDQVRNKKCLIIGTIAPPDENLLSIITLAHTLKKEGAKKVYLLLPYIAYARQDKPKAKESMMTALIGKVFKAAGIDEIVTIEVHSNHVAELFPMNLKSISPVKVFAEEIKKLNLLNASLVAPDKGALKRCEEIVQLLGMKHTPAYLDKERTHQGIKHINFHGDVSEVAIVIDDMLDTGGTLISCAQLLYKAGVKKIIIMVTHGIFAGDKWKKLLEIGVDIYCTDTIPQKVKSNKIKVLSILPLLKASFSENKKSRT